MGVSIFVGLAAGAAVAHTMKPDDPPPPPPPPKREPIQQAKEADKKAARAARRVKGQTSRADTILTSPLGVEDQSGTGGEKTLLGR